MIKKGLVNKKRSHLDERRVIVELTEEGKRILYRHTRLDAEKLRKILMQMDESDVQTIQKAFAILCEGAKKCLR